MRLAAVGDLRCTRQDSGMWAPRLAGVNTVADVLLLAGDLTDSGTLEELAVLLGELRSVSIPIVTVLGDQDYAGGRARVFAETLRRAGVHHLEGASAHIGNVTFVGALGAEGGFSRTPKRRLSYAERQLAPRLRHYLSTAGETDRRVVLLHYAPIEATLQGEQPEHFHLLGSSTMADAIDDVGADLILHAHACHGAPEGQTTGGVPVYNVALSLLKRLGNQSPYRIFELRDTISSL
jgi:Icc-related predicted phosphoesterase